MFDIFSKQNFLSGIKKYLLDELKNCYNPAKRLDIMLIDTNYDVFAADVYYHKASCNKFTYKNKKTPLPRLSMKLLFHTIFFAKVN